MIRGYNDADGNKRIEKELNDASKIMFSTSDVNDVIEENLGNTDRTLRKIASEDYKIFVLDDDYNTIFTTEPYLEDFERNIFLDTEEAYRKAIKTVRQLGEIPENHIDQIAESYMPDELTLTSRMERKGSIKSILKGNPNIKHNKVEERYEWKK